MPTRLSLWCERLIEAGWLVTLLLIPVFFQSTTARIFEPDKMMFVRAIALLMALAWLIQWVDTHMGQRTLAARPETGPGEAEKSGQGGSLAALVWPAGLFLVASIVATGASITPLISFLGSYQRAQGLYSLIALVIIFLLLLTHLRRRDQLERLVTTLIVGSLPVTLFALFQWLGAPPGVWRGLYNGRVFGTLGNPIFLGGYLIMLIPLTGARLARPAASVLRGLYGGILLLQVVVLLLTGSRGPWLGLMAGVIILVLAWAGLRGRRELAWLAIAGAVILGGVIGALNLPSVREQLTGAPSIVVRLSSLADFGSRSTGTVRLLLWDAAARVMGINPLRLPIGYGPESNIITLTANVSSEIRYIDRPDVSPDRAHNENWDRLIETGLLGLIGYLWLVATAIYLILKVLGLTGAPGQTRAYLILVGALTLVGGLAPLVMGLPGLSGLGMSVGLVGGVALYLLNEVLTGENQDRLDSEQQWLLLALLAALVGHYTEIAVGPANAVTKLLFWAFLGLIGALAARPSLSVAHEPSHTTEAVEPRPGGRQRRGAHDTPSSHPLVSAWAYGGLAGMMMATLVYCFVTLDDFSWSANQFAIVWFLGLTMMVGGVVLWLETRHEATTARVSTPTAWPIPGLMVGGLMLMLILRGLILATGGDALAMLWMFVLLLLTGLVLLAFWLPSPARGTKPGPAVGFALYAPLTLIVLAVVLLTNITPLRADMYIRAGEAYIQAGDPQTGLNLMTQAISSNQSEPAYASKLAETLSGLAQNSPTASARDEGFQQATVFAELAATAVPVNADYRYNVGNVYLLWGQATQDQSARTQRLAKAAQNFQEALQINPNAADAFVGWGLSSLLANQPPDATQTLLLQALALDSRNPQAYFYLGALYKAQNQPDAAERAYLNGLQYVQKTSPLKLTAYAALGDLYQKTNRLDEAVQMTQKAIDFAPNNWINHLNLALLYQRQGRKQEALEAAQIAGNLAPQDAKPRVIDVISQIR